MQGILLPNEMLCNYTTWRVGGRARYMYKPCNVADLVLFLKQLPGNEPLLWLGLGSNTLIRDNGFLGTVILTQGCLKQIQLLDTHHVYVEAGVSCASMARFCARYNLAGAEFWAGIPGTMGGALRMNAGCFGSETWQSVIKVETIARDGTLHTRTPAEFSIAYREISGIDNEWFVSATCKFNKGDKLQSLALIKQLLAHRAKTQPIDHLNCGSVFRNPPGKYAARLIEECGLKGTRIGKAAVSMKHANFIINEDRAALAQDIELLITLVRNTVFRQTKINLIPEIHIIGEP